MPERLLGVECPIGGLGLKCDIPKMRALFLSDGPKGGGRGCVYQEGPLLRCSVRRAYSKSDIAREINSTLRYQY